MPKVFLPKINNTNPTCSQTSSLYPQRFVKVTLPIQTRLLRNATLPIQTRLAFSINELLSAINDTKNTTPGPDNICYKMFKHMSIKSRSHAAAV